MTDTLNQDLKLLFKYLKCNKLSLNLSKNHSMLFSFSNILHRTLLVLKIEDSVIDTVECTSFLGVKIDHQLTFSKHLN
ncbi:MAG: hypothetical protein V2I33_19110, partial [Kangiellaceae bacterium]|nr:hypothetical protein [Kangiellaceae bacterium]